MNALLFCKPSRPLLRSGAGRMAKRRLSLRRRKHVRRISAMLLLRSGARRSSGTAGNSGTNRGNRSARTHGLTRSDRRIRACRSNRCDRRGRRSGTCRSAGSHRRNRPDRCNGRNRSDRRNGRNRSNRRNRSCRRRWYRRCADSGGCRCRCAGCYGNLDSV